MNWKDLNNEFNKSNYIGNYGADNIPMHILTKAKYNVDIRENIKKKSNDEFIDHDLKYLIEKVKNKKDNNWEKIATLNPYGLESNPPMISSVRARLDLENQM